MIFIGIYLLLILASGGLRHRVPSGGSPRAKGGSRRHRVSLDPRRRGDEREIVGEMDVYSLSDLGNRA